MMETEKKAEWCCALHEKNGSNSFNCCSIAPKQNWYDLYLDRVVQRRRLYLCASLPSAITRIFPVTRKKLVPKQSQQPKLSLWKSYSLSIWGFCRQNRCKANDTKIYSNGDDVARHSLRHCTFTSPWYFCVEVDNMDITTKYIWIGG